MNNLQAIIEGILYVVGDDGITLPQLADALELNEEEVQNALDKLGTSYSEDENRGIEMVCYGGRYKLVSKAISHDYCKKIFESSEVRGFSPAALETLAIIAYRQPVTKLEMEQIRGVKCDYSVQSLLAKGLITEVGRRDAVGRPILYGTTDAFLSHFGLRTLEELPAPPDQPKDEPEEEMEI